MLAALLSACGGSTGPQGATGPQGSPGPSGPPGGSGNPGAAPALDIHTASAITINIRSVSLPTVQFTLTDQNGELLSGLPASYDAVNRVGLRGAVARLAPGANPGDATQWISYFSHTVSSGTCPTGVAACANSPVTQATVDATYDANGKATYNGKVSYDAATGIYTYTFSRDITQDPGYDPTATHRVAFQLNGFAPANNAANQPLATFRPDGVTALKLTRDIVDTAVCNRCHQKIAAHGGARVEVQYCVMCHSPQTTDYFSGNTVDLKVMIHKIHAGNKLPSLGSPPNTAPVLGQGYWVGPSNFNTVLYPQDVRYCSTCHVTGSGALGNADNYEQVPTIEACGSCHDTKKFDASAAPDLHAGLSNKDCATCHYIDASNGLTAGNAHVPPGDKVAATFKYQINSVTFYTDGAGLQYPIVNFAIVDPTNGNAPRNILADPAFTGTDPGTGKSLCAGGGAARLAIDIGWETVDFTNWGSDPGGAKAASWGQPVSVNPLIPGAGSVPANCGGSKLAYGGAAVPATPLPSTLYGPDANTTFTLVGPALPTPPPATLCADGNQCAPVQNVGVVLEGHPAAVLKNLNATKVIDLSGKPIAAGAAQAQRIPVTSIVARGNTSGAAAVARRNVVDVQKCGVCHNSLQLHGNNRNAGGPLALKGVNDTQVCSVCHNPASTDVSQRPASGTGIDGLYERPIDFKHMIHGIHAANYLGTVVGKPFVVYGFGGNPLDFTDVVLPAGANLGNCTICHAGNNDAGDPSYYPSSALSQAMTHQTGLSAAQAAALGSTPPLLATTPKMAACSGCHQTDLAISHMEQNGGSKVVTKDAEGHWTPGAGAAAETCMVCHGPGAVADVKVVHGVTP